jgi:hypothetical protein
MRPAVPVVRRKHLELWWDVAFLRNQEPRSTSMGLACSAR